MFYVELRQTEHTTHSSYETRKQARLAAGVLAQHFNAHEWFFSNDTYFVEI